MDRECCALDKFKKKFFTNEAYNSLIKEKQQSFIKVKLSFQSFVFF